MADPSNADLKTLLEGLARGQEDVKGQIALFAAQAATVRKQMAELDTRFNAALAALALRVDAMEKRSPAGSSASTAASRDGSGRRERARTVSPHREFTAVDNELVLMGFRVEVTKKAVENWLLPIVDESKLVRPEVLCRSGSWSAKLVFPTGSDARAFYNLHKKPLSFAVTTGTHVCAPHDIAVKWPRTDRQRETGRLLAPA